jgi:hypothetical protein
MENLHKEKEQSDIFLAYLKRSNLFLIFFISILIGLVIFFSLRKEVSFKTYSFVSHGRIVKLVIGSEQDADSLFDIAQKEFIRVLEKYSFFLEQSIIFDMNRRIEELYAIDDETKALFLRIYSLSERTHWNYDSTQGVFFVSFLPYDTVFLNSVYPSEYSVSENIVHTNGKAFFFLGKALKGYAMDRMYAILKARDNTIKGFCEVDGDYLIFGPRRTGVDWIFNGWNSDLLYLSEGALFCHPNKKPLPALVNIEDNTLVDFRTSQFNNNYNFSAVIAPSALEAAVYLSASNSYETDFFLKEIVLWNSSCFLVKDDMHVYKNTDWLRYTYNH